ncbi:phage major capsid protein [Lachnospiraceae bacterium LCP25S3_G4]
MGRLKEIETRLSSIKAELEIEGADISALSTETDVLLEERTNLMKEIETRKATLERVAQIQLEKGEPIVKEEKRTFEIESKEYRNAWLKNIRKMELTDAEKRALTTGTSSAGSVVPTTTSNKIIDKVKQYCPMLDKIELLHIAGSVTVPAEGTTTDAALHTEGASITGDEDTLSNVTLNGFEITKLVTISKSVETMSIDAFENWLTNKIARKVADKINALIISGTGTNQPQGANAIIWDNTNSVTVAKAASLTEANVTTVVSLMNGGYLTDAEWYMSSSTFFSDFYQLMNNSKNNVVTETNGTYRVMGKVVNFDDRVTAHEAILGDFYRGYLGNLQEDVTLTSQFVVRENSFDFLGCAIFDGKVQAKEAFVKIAKATA